MIKETLFYSELDDKKVLNTLSPKEEILNNNEYDKSGILKNIDGKLQILNYGQIITMKTAHLKDFIISNSVNNQEALSIGFLGNNLKTSFDQYWSTSQYPVIKQIESNREETSTMISSLGTFTSPTDLVNYCNSKRIINLVFTYSEPILSIDYILEVIKLAKDSNIKVYLITNGYFNAKLIEPVIQALSGIVIKLHSIEESFYKKHCKVDLKYILKTIQVFNDSDIDLQISTTIIPDTNDSTVQLRQIAEYLSRLKISGWQIHRFYPTHKILDKQKTTNESLSKAKGIGSKFGLKSIVFTK